MGFTQMIDKSGNFWSFFGFLECMRLEVRLSRSPELDQWYTECFGVLV